MTQKTCVRGIRVQFRCSVLGPRVPGCLVVTWNQEPGYQYSYFSGFQFRIRESGRKVSVFCPFNKTSYPNPQLSSFDVRLWGSSRAQNPDPKIKILHLPPQSFELHVL